MDKVNNSMHLPTVKVSDELPLLASVVWGTVGREDVTDSYRDLGQGGDPRPIVGILSPHTVLGKPRLIS